jgi:predicted TIM-barrel fold metal-dependent hydrolase
LKGINFPAMRDGDLPEYNRRQWEPFWQTCEERQMPLITHVGSATNANYSGLESVALLQIESGNFASKRAIWWMIFAGVFERHPGLKLVITETPGSWFTTTADELDGVYSWYEAKREEPLNKALFEQVPRRPSEYMAQNVFFGASFASPLEVEQAILHGIDSQLLWGSDYPHLEGTFVYQEDRDLASVTRLSLRNTFSNVPEAEMRRMVGGNAIDVYNLDAHALQEIARKIDAPDVDELSTPIDAVPAGASATAFRSGAGGWS